MISPKSVIQGAKVKTKRNFQHNILKDLRKISDILEDNAKYKMTYCKDIPEVPTYEKTKVAYVDDPTQIVTKQDQRSQKLTPRNDQLEEI